VSTTPANNPCHGFSVIAGAIDTGDKFLTGEQLLPGDNNIGDKFIASDNDTVEQLSPTTTTPVNNYRRRQRHRL
jgi:hypothetical protein